MLDHILVPLDGSALAETVLPHLVTLARAHESQVTMLRVMDPAAALASRRAVDPLEWQIHKAEAESYLRGISERMEAEGLQVNTVLQEGRAAEGIVDFAGEHDIDLILLSSHGQSGISGWNVSSVVQKVILRARTSIFLVRAYQIESEKQEPVQYRRIMLPLDGSQRAEWVLPAALLVAKAHEAQLLIIHVVEEPEMPRRTPLSEEDQELKNRLVDRNRQEADRYLDDLRSRLGGNVETRLEVSTSVSGALHEAVEREGVDLVVLSAHGYSGQSRWPYGSNVISFIAYGTTPLLVVQDLPRGSIELTQAEIAAREQGGH